MNVIKTTALDTGKATILASSTLQHNFDAVAGLYSDFIKQASASNPIKILALAIHRGGGRGNRGGHGSGCRNCRSGYNGRIPSDTELLKNCHIVDHYHNGKENPNLNK